MRIKYASLSVAGPVRANNEDYLTFWEPSVESEWRTRGAAVVLADGVGGHGNGEVASRLACDHALAALTGAKAGSSPGQLLWQMFTAANLAVYDAGMHQRSGGRMLTTLTIALFRNNEISIGHVGDCRAYVIQQGRIRRITSDHSYAGVQVKLGLTTVQEAASSQLRSVLTRTVGQDPLIRIDNHTATVDAGDRYVHCTDGLWSMVTEKEILEIVSKRTPEDACRELIDLAEKRGADDNLSLQVIHIESVERPSFYRGQTVYHQHGRPKANPMDSELEVGDVLDGRFQITDLVSRSGMASIFKANDIKIERTVALKVPFMHFESDPGFYSRFQREQEIGTALNHPYILKVEPDDGNRSRPYMVMEYLEGQTLGHLMRSVRPMPVSDAVKIVSRICEALHYMHNHDVVHRDLKPENIMICNDGSIRIMDFGIARYDAMRRLTFGGFTPAMGTPDYMAPEQVKGKRGDRRTDIYSLGAILYEMVTGAVPFEGATPFLIMNARLSGDPIAPRQRIADLPPAVEEIILHAMERNPNDRYPDAMSMKHDLDHLDQVHLTGRANRLQAPVAWKSRWRMARVTVIAVIVPLIVAAAFYVYRHLQWRP